jgi:hypothetical protein
MRKIMTFILILLLGISAAGAFAQNLQGSWVMDTELIQAMTNEAVVWGFAVPERENRITSITLNTENIAFIEYAGKEYRAIWEKKDQFLMLGFQGGDTIYVTIAPMGTDRYKFSYALANGTEALDTGYQKETFLNYIGTMRKK